jgi:predicted ATPase
MIKSFAVDNKPFSLVPDAVLAEPTSNVFSANSMTLLVGPNGSGKTHILLALANAIASGTYTQAQIEWDTDTDMHSTFALYFTPIPYDTNMPVENRHVMALHPARTRGKILAEVDTAMDLANAFGLDARPILNLGTYSSALNVLKEMLFHPYRTGRPVYRFREDWMAPLAAREAEISSNETLIRRLLRERDVKFEEIQKNEEMRKLQTQKTELDRKIQENIESRLGEDFALRVRALQYVARAQRLSKNVKIALLNELNIPVEDEASAQQPKALERLSSASSVLRKISNILDDRRLAHSRYEISLEQWKILSGLSLTGLAELSINDASSGSAALLNQFARLKDAVNKIARKQYVRNLVLLIDEGDAFLHLDWQQRYINYLDMTIGNLWRKRFDTIQVVLTTHSPVLMSDFPRDCIHKLASYPGVAVSSTAEFTGYENKFLSFAAPLDAIVRSVGGAGTIGMFAARVMQKLLLDVEAGVVVNTYHLEMIDDPVIKRHIYRIIGQQRLGNKEMQGIDRAD